MTWPQYDERSVTLSDAVSTFIEQSNHYAERATRLADGEASPEYVTMHAALSTMYAQHALVALALLAQRQDGPGLA